MDETVIPRRRGDGRPGLATDCRPLRGPRTRTDLFSRPLVPSPDALDSRVDDETVILHLGNDTYYGLDTLGTHIWGLLKEGTSLPGIRDRLAQEYGVGADRIEADMVRFLNHLLDHSLLVDG